ncbi:coiled-coil domain-containing protein 12 [Lingula anatina]|uniref:Coiled-coil domain-containing protein 12 n=1 Tax=Lingula anatina TaxID=7574 RepID=A0A1S3J5Z9_LINAN|nr:coiled-coil domain-containing protein 12 [Lingula anatina]|eukprot:XP_013405733.1 coiled-coil domain-containing protein 12 [Lingula anatina]
MAEVGQLEDAALKRKERLRRMRQRAEGDGEGLEAPDAKRSAGNENEMLPKPVFRSYKPQDENLKENALPQMIPSKVEEHVKDHLEAAKPEPVVDEIDLTNLAPRKPDWDLKRDVAKKLEKLERRTQRAIAELIRDRLQAGKEDLATAVNASAEVMQKVGDDADDDDDEEN